VSDVAQPYDPRPTASRHTDDVPVTLVSDRHLDELEVALRSSTARAIDTETVYQHGDFTHVPGQLRVVSLATRDRDGVERAWVIDANHIDRVRLAVALAGITADAWNADFDARVLDRDVMAVGHGAGLELSELRWWDAQLADALIHQGMSGFGFYHGLAWAAEWYLGIRAEGKGTTQLSYTADGELSDEQVRYAAADAIETMWVSDEIRARIDKHDLATVCHLEQHARPFLDHMERAGLPFDWNGWQAELDAMTIHRVEVLGQLAELTGGGQGSLFSAHLEPSWNPGSENQTKDILNRYSRKEVAAWSFGRFGETRRLEPTDPLTATVLSDIGGEICEQLLTYRDLTKTLSTYGDTIREFIRDDGRLHSEYLQVVGTNTGRLASRNPNAQNLTPKMKPFFRPDDQNRVFVHADLSQAELRFLAHVSEDENLLQAFIDGIDVHVATSERMFGEDMTDLRENNRPRYDELRATSKRINFGIVYGQRGAGLARSLSHSGVETTTDEAKQLLDSYLAAYPQVSEWCDGRDRFIDEMAADHQPCNWPLTLRLHTLWPLVRRARRSFRDLHRRWPTAEEAHALVVEADREVTLDEVAWTLSFSAPVALDSEGTPFGFASFTPAGRRQQFTFHVEGLLDAASLIVARSAKAGPTEVRRRMVDRFDIRFEEGGAELSDRALSKLLEDRALRRAIIDEVDSHMGPAATATLLDRALDGRIERLANSYRNAPIQGGVADVMLEAYGLLHERLAVHPNAVGVQTVHDSVVVECDADEAPQVARLVKDTLEDAMRAWCPNIPAVADTDIRRSLSDSDVYEMLD
jgi:DNA polymerase I-like protein with 3'-5' exonuclease and polymerase domains